MRETVIVGALRTPFGTFGGSLKQFTAVDLGGIVIKELVKRAGIKGNDVDLVIMGQVLQGGCGQIPSRQASIKAGLPVEVPSETLNKVCASSLRAVTMADQIIRSGDADVIIAGGMESMSNAPYFTQSNRWGQRMMHSQLVDLMVHDGLWCAFHDRHMAANGSIVAAEYGISREEQDKWAYRSQMKAKEAMEKGKLQSEIIPVEIKTKQGPKWFNEDEGPRPNTRLEDLSKLPPVFTKGGSVTAGNAPSVNDGASALLLMSREKAEQLNVTPLATIVGHAMASAEPAYIATVPALATQKALVKTGLHVDDLDVIEVNEAFAAVALTSTKMIGWDVDKVNVNGGAIAYGHPIGASGGRILSTLIYEMIRRDVTYGLAAICSGAAQGDAIIIKR